MTTAWMAAFLGLATVQSPSSEPVVRWPSVVTAQTPGCAVGAARDGATVRFQQQGLADLDHGVPIGPDTVFEAGSASKQFTAAAVLMLAAEGRLSLDDDIRTHLPELSHLGETITVTQLLEHTSGLRDWRMIRALAGWTLGTAVHTNEDALEVVAMQRGLNHAPGAAFSYTNSGYSLLAIIVERVAGQSLADFSRARIFQPLGMTRTRWRDSFRTVVPGRAVAYGRDPVSGGWEQDMPFENAYGAGGLLTTVGDLLIWNRALDQDLLGITQALETAGRLDDGTATPYGRGLFLRRYRGVHEVAHGGITAGYVAYVARYPDQRTSVVVLCNNGRVNPRLLAEGVADDLLTFPPDGVTDATEVSPPPSDSRPLWRPGAQELSAVVGLYRSDEIGADYRIEQRDGRLWLVLQGVPMQERGISPSYADELVFQGGNLRLERRDGAVVGFTLGIERARGLKFRRLAPDG